MNWSTRRAGKEYALDGTGYSIAEIADVYAVYRNSWMVTTFNSLRKAMQFCEEHNAV